MGLVDAVEKVARSVEGLSSSPADLALVELARTLAGTILVAEPKEVGGLARQLRDTLAALPKAGSDDDDWTAPGAA